MTALCSLCPAVANGLHKFENRYWENKDEITDLDNCGLSADVCCACESARRKIQTRRKRLRRPVREHGPERMEVDTRPRPGPCRERRRVGLPGGRRRKPLHRNRVFKLRLPVSIQ